MHTQEDIRLELKRLDKILGIDTSGLEIGFSGRMTKRLGSCSLKRDEKGSWSPVKITIASFMKNEPPDAFYETVRHEYAHAAASIITGEKCGHGKVWKDICRKIGCSGNRLSEMSEAAKKTRREKARYIIRCTKCAAETCYQRRTKLIDALLAGKKVSVVCLRCGGKSFEIEYRK